MSSNAGADCADVMASDGHIFDLGSIEIEARKPPGHTNGYVSCVVDAPGELKRVLTGDTLLIRGCGRTDIQADEPDTLYESVHIKLFTLPDNTQVFPGHDYRGRTMSTIAEEKVRNPRLGRGRKEEAFKAIMAELNLALPKHIHEAVPANQLQVERRADGVPEVTVQWTLETFSEYRLIDVHGELGHLEGTEHVPNATLAAAMKEWRTDQPLIIVCRSGNRSGKAALQLEEAGFSDEGLALGRQPGELKITIFPASVRCRCNRCRSLHYCMNRRYRMFCIVYCSRSIALCLALPYMVANESKTSMRVYS